MKSRTSATVDAIASLLGLGSRDAFGQSVVHDRYIERGCSSMHALRAFVEHEMGARGWGNQDLVRSSGISKQVVSDLLKDSRDRLTAMPGDKTIDGLARGFGIDRSVVLAKVGEAMGLPIAGPVVVYDASRVSDAELLRELASRLDAASAIRQGAPRA